MKKLNVTKALLWVVTATGGYLVTQGIVTGAELSELTNIVGMVMAGGGVSANAIIYILSNIPTTLVTKGYDKAVETYGKDKVDNLLNKFDDAMTEVALVKDAVSKLLEELQLDRDIKNELGVYEPLSTDLKDRL
jgi:hypothetical protein